VGVDLGQAADPTAVCILEAYSQREEPTKPEEFFGSDNDNYRRLTSGLGQLILARSALYRISVILALACCASLLQSANSLFFDAYRSECLKTTLLRKC
jgi:hypothetical protein